MQRRTIMAGGLLDVISPILHPSTGAVFIQAGGKVSLRDLGTSVVLTDPFNPSNTLRMSKGNWTKIYETCIYREHEVRKLSEKPALGLPKPWEETF